ncbi:hypothetical protein DMC30DRAFT_398250 [Rhodotorula diobovata]|uniref:Secreted protein n=1 Tax=Rhodotorula diobovata TaxID=5288 RepID=A0A5C5FTY4_9BASI|nr:hypothetical protein DMC30DRAFT_398250 [Rhodotorula diobovata]
MNLAWTARAQLVLPRALFVVGLLAPRPSSRPVQQLVDDSQQESRPERGGKAHTRFVLSRRMRVDESVEDGWDGGITTSAKQREREREREIESTEGEEEALESRSQPPSVASPLPRIGLNPPPCHPPHVVAASRVFRRSHAPSLLSSAVARGPARGGSSGAGGSAAASS